MSRSCDTAHAVAACLPLAIVANACSESSGPLVSAPPPLVRIDLEPSRGEAESPAWLSVENEARLAWPFKGRVKLHGRGRIPASGARLSIGFAGREPRRDEGETTLVCRWRCAGGASGEERWTAANAWSDREVALPAEGSEVFEIELEAEGSGDRLGTLAVGDPVIYVPVERAPTVVLVTLDTHRADHVEGAPGGIEIRTPALRELAARGVSFVDCFSTTNVTLPSHVAILTGLAPCATGITDNHSYVSDEPETLAECFRDAGYATVAALSVNILAPQFCGMGQGFDRTSWPPRRRLAGETVDEALRMLDSLGDRPVFLWLHIYDAHSPYTPPAPFDQMYYPGGRDPRAEAGAPMRPAHWIEDVRDPEYVRALYRGEISSSDTELRRFLDHPRVRSAVVGVTGDHGEVLGNHGVWWEHEDVYPDTLHVPLILAWPGGPKGRTTDRPVSNVDLGRTLLDLCGLRARPFPGRDLTRALDGAAGAAEPRFALSAHGHAAAIERDGWLLILGLSTPVRGDVQGYAREPHSIELYSLAEDPACAHDRVGEDLERAKSMRADVIEWLARWRGERFVLRKNRDAGARRELAELGYAGDADEAAPAAKLIDPRCACAQCSRWR